MNIDQIHYVIEVAKTKSLSIAAKNLHVTQSTISQSISNLENELKIKVFNRSRGHGALLTDEGKVILKLMCKAQETLTEIKETASEMNSAETGNLKVSSVPSMTRFLVKAMANFRHEFPHVNVEIAENTGYAILNDVREHEVDIGIASFQPDLNMDMAGVVFNPFIQGKMKIYVSKHSPLAAFDTVTPHELLEQTLVAYGGEYMQFFYQDFFARYKPLEILFTSTNVGAILQAINENLAMTFAPDFIMNNFVDVKNGNIIPIELVDHHIIETTLGLFRPKDKKMPTFANRYIHYLNAELMKSYKEPIKN